MLEKQWLHPSPTCNDTALYLPNCCGAARGSPVTVRLPHPAAAQLHFDLHRQLPRWPRHGGLCGWRWPETSRPGCSAKFRAEEMVLGLKTSGCRSVDGGARSSVARGPMALAALLPSPLGCSSTNRRRRRPLAAPSPQRRGAPVPVASGASSPTVAPAGSLRGLI